MNEIPKLRYCGMFECDLDDRDVDTEYKDNIGLITCISKKSYKEVLAFWDKYKDNPIEFSKEFHGYLELFIKEKIIYTKFKDDYTEVNLIDLFKYRDWLHDKLFKLGE